MQLYYSDILSSRKACAVARYLKSPVEFRYLDLVKGDQQKPAYLAVNPNGKVPTLIDGEHVVWEADAVICYLAKVAGSGSVARRFAPDRRHPLVQLERAAFLPSRRHALLREHREAPLRYRRAGPNRGSRGTAGIPPLRRRPHRTPRRPPLAGRRRPHRGRLFGGHHAAVCRPGRHAAARNFPWCSAGSTG